MTTNIDGDSSRSTPTSIDDTDSPYTTQDEELYTVDTTSGTLTVQLASSDATAGHHKRFVDIGGNIETNAVTFTTQSSETIDGGSSATWNHNNGSYIDLWSDGTNWFSSLQGAADLFAVDDLRSDAEQPQDVSGSRSDNTWVQNTSDYPLQVYVTGTGSGAGTVVYAYGHVNTSQTNNIIAQTQNVAHDSTTILASTSFVVPPGHHYKVDFSGSTTIERWFEQKLGSP